MMMEENTAADVIILNIIFVIVALTRVTSIPRPRTDGFWNDIFPYLIDEDGADENLAFQDIFKRHFRVTRATFFL